MQTCKWWFLNFFSKFFCCVSEFFRHSLKGKNKENIKKTSFLLYFSLEQIFNALILWWKHLDACERIWIVHHFTRGIFKRVCRRDNSFFYSFLILISFLNFNILYVCWLDILIKVFVLKIIHHFTHVHQLSEFFFLSCHCSALFFFNEVSSKFILPFYLSSLHFYQLINLPISNCFIDILWYSDKTSFISDSDEKTKILVQRYSDKRCMSLFH